MSLEGAAHIDSKSQKESLPSASRISVSLFSKTNGVKDDNLSPFQHLGITPIAATVALSVNDAKVPKVIPLKPLVSGSNSELESVALNDAHRLSLSKSTDVDEARRFKLDMATRPDAMKPQDYESIEVEEFGEAMLRGMGWAPGRPVGRHSTAVVEPVEFVARYDNRGLGASITDAGLRNKEVSQPKYIRPGESREGRVEMQVAPDASGRITNVRKIGQDLVPVSSVTLGVGSLVEVTRGPYSRQHGHVLEFDSGSFALLNIGSSTISVLKADIRLVPFKDSVSSTQTFVDPALSSTPAIATTKRPAEDTEPKHANKHEKKRSRRDISWVLPYIKVRIVSKSFKNGLFFNKKGIVMDIPSVNFCSIKLESGEWLEEVSEDALETVVPRQGMVTVVRGDARGQQGILVERSSKDETVVIKLRDSNDLLTLKYDDVSESQQQ